MKLIAWGWGTMQWANGCRRGLRAGQVAGDEGLLLLQCADGAQRAGAHMCMHTFVVRYAAAARHMGWEMLLRIAVAVFAYRTVMP